MCDHCGDSAFERAARIEQGLWRKLAECSNSQYAVKVGDLQWVQIPSGQSVARPEAIRATKEATNSLKYSGKGHLG